MCLSQNPACKMIDARTHMNTQKAFHEGTLETLFRWSTSSAGGADAEAEDAEAELPQAAAGGGGQQGEAAGEEEAASLPPLAEGELAGMPMEELTQRCVLVVWRV